MEHLFSSLLGGTIADTFGGGRLFTLTLRDGRVIERVAGSYEPKHTTLNVVDGIELRVPFPRLLLRRDQLLSAGITDLQRDVSGALVQIDGSGLTLDDVVDDGWTFLEARLSDFTETVPEIPSRSFL